MGMSDDDLVVDLLDGTDEEEDSMQEAPTMMITTALMMTIAIAMMTR